MKNFLIVAGLLSLIATPAFAQSFDPDMGTGNNVPFAYVHQTAYSHQTKDSANRAFAREDNNAQGDQLENYNEGHGNLGGSVHNGYVVDGY